MRWSVLGGGRGRHKGVEPWIVHTACKTAQNVESYAMKCLTRGSRMCYGGLYTQICLLLCGGRFAALRSSGQWEVCSVSLTPPPRAGRVRSLRCSPNNQGWCCSYCSCTDTKKITTTVDVTTGPLYGLPLRGVSCRATLKISVSNLVNSLRWRKRRSSNGLSLGLSSRDSTS
jgi:hypothetical protein